MFWEGFVGASSGLLGCSAGSFFHACIWSVLQKCSWGHLGWILAGLKRVWEVFWERLGRVMGGLGRDFRAFWVILGCYSLFWVIGAFLANLRKIFAGAPCCLLLLCWGLSSKSVLAFASCLLLGRCVCTMKYGTHFELKL